MNCITVNVFSRPLRVEYAIVGQSRSETYPDQAEPPQLRITGYYRGDKDVTATVKRAINFLDNQHKLNLLADIHKKIEEREQISLA